MGILAAAAVYALGSIRAVRANDLFNPDIMVALAPATILGLAEPSSPGEIALLLAIVFATNFVLYGIVGLLLCGAWSLFRPASQSLNTGGSAHPK
ncbi:MAG: hypothetical protein WBP69_18405 [Terriglobales bacterium]